MSKSKLTSRDIKAVETKSRIFQTAYKLISEKEYENVSISDICKSADVSIGAFYHHYKGKDDILLEIYSQADKHYNESLSGKKFHNYTTKLETYITSYFEYSANTTGYNILKHIFRSDNRLFQMEDRPLMKNLLNIIEAGQKSSEFRTDKSANELFEFVLVTIRGVIFNWCVNEGTEDLLQKQKLFTEFILLCLKNNSTEQNDEL
ncbi:TetR/AcrR family transcriptional regulator [Peribacillus asahii]|uniref:TetR family transcriptional regulator n=1 Tax=Peribacillus asahii TaxID=228899 RepID=A0A3T0KUH0_9BACI|nr:TetR/AcrR family transcriptional regulator [Peribacillus asahii]AZV43923.1 TetR family transcriptional regulator [Peribacillus asahii]USK83669.1 TetR/AcrR family transcriptional regulator [Peribacillus asahii]